MRYFVFNPEDLSIRVAGRKQDGMVNIKASGWAGEDINHPVSNKILFDVIYPAVYARGKRVSYSLISPDRWLVAIGLVMWEGIVQGLTWDTIKLSVKKALGVMTAAELAPRSRNESKKKRTNTEFGFVWTEYRDGRKQHQMFLGLRRAYEQEKKKKSKR